jgi:hypothetical protein
MENNKVKVSKLEDALDNVSLITKIAIAGLGIITGALGVASGVRTWKEKHSNPDAYWENKKRGAEAGHKLIANGLNNIADALRNK